MSPNASSPAKHGSSRTRPKRSGCSTPRSRTIQASTAVAGAGLGRHGPQRLNPNGQGNEAHRKANRPLPSRSRCLHRGAAHRSDNEQAFSSCYRRNAPLLSSPSRSTRKSAGYVILRWSIRRGAKAVRPLRRDDDVDGGVVVRRPFRRRLLRRQRSGTGTGPRLSGGEPHRRMLAAVKLMQAVTRQNRISKLRRCLHICDRQRRGRRCGPQYEFCHVRRALGIYVRA